MRARSESHTSASTGSKKDQQDGGRLMATDVAADGGGGWAGVIRISEGQGFSSKIEDGSCR